MPNSSQDNRPLDWLDDQLEALERDGLFRSLRTRAGRQGEMITLGGRALLNFGSNDYLGLAGDRRLTAAAMAAAEIHGLGSGASPLVCGHTEVHEQLQQALAKFEQRDAALFFSSGFAANVGMISALVGRDDIIFADAKNHASLIDGCRLSRAEIHIYDHGDCDHLESLVRGVSAARRRLIVTDSLFSMDGDLAPLQQIAQVRDRYGCMLMVDEAHATGVFGANGRGVAEHLGVETAIDAKIGTLSKAFGAGGGFACGSASLITWLINRARPYIFSTAPPTPIAAAALEALRIVRDEPQRRRDLLDRAAQLRVQLTEQGWDVGDSASQIIPVRVGQPDRTMRLAAQLAEAGFFVPGIRPPSVPENESLLRLSLTSRHSPATIQRLVQTLAALRNSQF